MASEAGEEEVVEEAKLGYFFFQLSTTTEIELSKFITKKVVQHVCM